jgi:chaperonin GroES
MNLKPLSDRVVVKVLDADEKSPGGIYIPPTAKEKPQIGEIIAAGPGRTTDEGRVAPMEVKVGDKVIFGKYTGNEVESEGTKYLIMRESDILSVVGD